MLLPLALGLPKTDFGLHTVLTHERVSLPSSKSTPPSATSAPRADCTRSIAGLGRPKKARHCREGSVSLRRGGGSGCAENDLLDVDHELRQVLQGLPIVVCTVSTGVSISIEPSTRWGTQGTLRTTALLLVEVGTKAGLTKARGSGQR